MTDEEIKVAEEFLKCGDPAEACEKVGISKRRMGGIFFKKEFREYIKNERDRAEGFIRSVMDDEEASLKDRMHAAELVCKMKSPDTDINVNVRYI